jgi:hypothetical protein
MRHVATPQLISRREDGIRGMDHSINPRNSRDAEQHTYETRGSSSATLDSYATLKNPKFPSRASRSRSFLNDPTDFRNPLNLGKFYHKSCD